MLKKHKAYTIKILIRLLFVWVGKLCRNFAIINILLSITISGCQKQSHKFNQEQREKLNWFFKEFLLEHGGAYTLFGSKPMALESLLELSPETLDNLELYFKEHPEIEPLWIERHLEEGWNEWQKIAEGFSFKNYILKEINLNDEKIVILANRKNVVKTITDHYSEFAKILSRPFNPEKIVEELQNSDTGVWSLILQDHICKGLLLGYGVRNTHLFNQTVREKNHLIEMGASENNDPRLSPETTLDDTPFRIPIFRMFDGEESRNLVEKYKQEREEIKSYYQGKDFLEGTLTKLIKG